MRIAKLSIAICVFIVLLSVAIKNNQRGAALSQPDFILSTYADNVFWSNNAKSILTANDEFITIWDIGKSPSIGMVTDTESDITSVAWSPSDRMVAVGYGNGKIHIWDVDSQEIYLNYKHAQWIPSIEWSPNEEMIAISGREGASIIDVDTGENIASFQDVTWLKWSPDGTLLLGRDKNDDLQVVDIDSLKLLTKISHVSFVVMHPNDARIAGISPSGITIWDLDTGGIITEIKHTTSDLGLSWSPDGKYIAGSRGIWMDKLTHPDFNDIHIWDTITGRMAAKLEGHQDTVTKLAWNIAGNSLASYSSDNTIRVWNTSRGELVHTIVLSPKHYFVRFSPNGGKVAMIDFKRQVAIWKLHNN